MATQVGRKVSEPGSEDPQDYVESVPTSSSPSTAGLQEDPSENLSVSSNLDQSDKSSRQWAWFNSMKNVIKTSRGAVNDAVLSLITSSLDDTRLIFVVGPSGRGKTTLLNELSGDNLKVGGTLKSGTLRYDICPAIIDDKQYIFVDTAGFGAADLDDLENLDNIRNCLLTMGKVATPSGVLFLYGRPEARLMAHDLRTVQWIQCFCGPEFFEYITIITSKWDEFKEKAFIKYWKLLEQLREQPDMKRIADPPEGDKRYHGAKFYDHGFPDGKGSEQAYTSIFDHDDNKKDRADAAIDFIRSSYHEVVARNVPKLQFMREIENGTPWDETQAAKVLRADSGKNKIEICSKNAVIKSREGGNPVLLFPGVSKPATGNEGAGKKVEKEPDGTSSQNDTKSSKGNKKQEEARDGWSAKKVFGWFGAMVDAATYFKEVREKAAKGNKSKTQWGGIWGTFTNWWSASS